MSHNIINKIIMFDKRYEFCFLDDYSIKIMHPVSNYFLKINDLSINLLISLKWILWGFFFLSSISKELKSEIYTYSMETIINNALQLKFDNYIEKDHIILIDNHTINNEEELKELISNFYNNEVFNENTKIHLKLKLNLREYLIISNVLFPTLSIFEKINL